MKHEDISPELQKLLDETPVLTEQDVKELGDAVEALDAEDTEKNKMEGIKK